MFSFLTVFSLLQVPLEEFEFDGGLFPPPKSMFEYDDHDAALLLLLCPSLFSHVNSIGIVSSSLIVCTVLLPVLFRLCLLVIPLPSFEPRSTRSPPPTPIATPVPVLLPDKTIIVDQQDDKSNIATVAKSILQNPYKIILFLFLLLFLLAVTVVAVTAGGNTSTPDMMNDGRSMITTTLKNKQCLPISKLKILLACLISSDSFAFPRDFEVPPPLAMN